MNDVIFITGATGSLGSAFVRQYAMNDDVVHACCRNPDKALELKALQETYPKINIHKLDVTSQEDIDRLQKQIIDPIDVLINNAGHPGKDLPFGELSVDLFVEVFLVNAVAPLKIAEAFAPHLAMGKKKVLANITSRLSSIQLNIGGRFYNYRAAKVALNMIMKNVAIDLEEKEIKVLLLHPGWVQSRMGGAVAELTAEQSVEGMRRVISSADVVPGEAMFYNYKGEGIPW